MRGYNAPLMLLVNKEGVLKKFAAVRVDTTKFSLGGGGGHATPFRLLINA